VTGKIIWRAIVLAAGRGPADPMAKAFHVTHKCTIPVANKPMLKWVLEALQSGAFIRPTLVVIDDGNAAIEASEQSKIEILKAENSAPASALSALRHLNEFPALITTADHPLLTSEMLTFATQAASASKADICVCLARSETILNQYPDNKRTFFKLGGTRVSGCNIFAVLTPNGLKLLELWQDLEKHRKQPWKLAAAFGLKPLLWYALGVLTPDRAFNHVSQMLGIQVQPIFMPFAEAAIDVDKPSDHALAEAILLKRLNPT
jgi:GTP:adenosylcobinamide-phosphate guanylyltransferase